MNRTNLRSHTKIGIFDSGIGGLSILKELLKIPGLDLTYLADSKNVPYGNKTPAHIRQLSQAAVEFLIQKNITLIIIACHTVSTQALEYLRTLFPSIDFVGTPELILQQTAPIIEPKKIGIIGTQATIESGVLEKQLINQNPLFTIISQPCPELASLIEQESSNNSKIQEMIVRYLEPLRQEKIDFLILGCTHYALIQPLINHFFKGMVRCISAEQAIDQFLLKSFQIENKSSNLDFIISGDNERFFFSFQQFLGFIPEKSTRSLALH